MRLRIGIAGAKRGTSFLAGLQAAGHGRLVAIYDPSREARERFGHEHGLDVICESYAQLLDQIDAVVLSSPQQYHAPQAVMALRAGRHVLSEVPAAVSMEQAHDLLAATRASAAGYMLAENYCYTRPNLIVRAMAQAGVFGELYFAEGEYLHELNGLFHDVQGHPTWRYFWQAGRDGHTYPTHSLGPVLQWLDDRLVAVSCIGSGRHTDPEHTLEDTVLLLGRTAKGALLKVRFDLLSRRPHLMDFYSLQGTGGAYEAPRAPGETPRVYLHGCSAEGQWEPLERYANRYLPARYREAVAGAGHGGADTWPIRDFVDAIVRGARPPIDVYAALDMTLPGIISEQSLAQNGAWLAVPDPRFMTAGIDVEPGPESPLT